MICKFTSLYQLEFHTNCTILITDFSHPWHSTKLIEDQYHIKKQKVAIFRANLIYLWNKYYLYCNIEEYIDEMHQIEWKLHTLETMYQQCMIEKYRRLYNNDVQIIFYKYILTNHVNIILSYL